MLLVFICITIKVSENSYSEIQYQSRAQNSDRSFLTVKEIIGYRALKTLTCPIIFKAIEEMEDHHDQSMERDECNIHLG